MFTETLGLFALPIIPGPLQVYVRLAEGVNVGAMVTTELLPQPSAEAVPVPATIAGAIVAFATVRITSDSQPFVAVITAV